MMTPLTPPEIQAAEVRERFASWWMGQGVDESIRTVRREEVELLCRAAYLQGQLDGADRMERLTLDAFGLDACRFCGAPLPPNPAPLDPMIPELGRLCSCCLTLGLLE